MIVWRNCFTICVLDNSSWSSTGCGFVRELLLYWSVWWQCSWCVTGFGCLYIKLALLPRWVGVDACSSAAGVTSWASFLLQLLTCLRKMQSVDIFSEACNFLIPLDNLHISPYFFSKNLHCIFSLFLLIFLSPSPSSLTKFFNNFSTIWSHVFNMNWKHE